MSDLVRLTSTRPGKSSVIGQVCRGEFDFSDVDVENSWSNEGGSEVKETEIEIREGNT